MVREPEDKVCSYSRSLSSAYNDNSTGPAIFLSFVIQNTAIIDLAREYDQGVD